MCQLGSLGGMGLSFAFLNENIVFTAPYISSAVVSTPKLPASRCIVTAFLIVLYTCSYFRDPVCLFPFFLWRACIMFGLLLERALRGCPSPIFLILLSGEQFFCLYDALGSLISRHTAGSMQFICHPKCFSCCSFSIHSRVSAYYEKKILPCFLE